MEEKIEELLIDMGIYPNLSGFRYICKAIPYILKDKTAKITYVYFVVSEEFGVTWTAVERAIRVAMTKINKNSEPYKKYINADDITASQFLYLFAMRLERE